jgi:hypothetical protein
MSRSMENIALSFQLRKRFIVHIWLVIRVDPNICRNILNLPIKDGKSVKMLDRYICRVGCDINIKIRDEDLKMKNLHDKTHAGIERQPQNSSTTKSD